MKCCTSRDAVSGLFEELKGALHHFYGLIVLVSTAQLLKIVLLMYFEALKELCQICKKNPDDVLVMSSRLFQQGLTL